MSCFFSFSSKVTSLFSRNSQTRLFASSLQRIERIISNRGVGSRSEVSKLLKQGRVKVNGKVERSSSNKYHEDVAIEIDGAIVQGISLLAVYHKPVGIISSVGDPWGRHNLEGVYASHSSLSNMHPVGRLDADTSGLLLFSKEGPLTQHLLNPQSNIPRTYDAIVLGSVIHNQLKEILSKGVQTTDGVFGGILIHSEVLDIESKRQKSETSATLVPALRKILDLKERQLFTQLDDVEDTDMPDKNTNTSTTSTIATNNATNITLPIDLSSIDMSLVSLSVTEGKYRMVRRILHNAGHTVLELRRLQYGNVVLGDLPLGQVRTCTADETAWARSLMR